MKLEVFADADAAAREAAQLIAEQAHRSVAEHGRFLIALSGGSTPRLMLDALSSLALPWQNTEVFQVDERFAELGSDARNFTQIQASLLAGGLLAEAQVHPMPVDADDPQLAARRYAATLTDLAGAPPVLDLAHLGLGTDGHTASLVPGDPALNVDDRAVCATQPYQGRRRLTLTYPVLNRARRILWLVTGESKAPMLQRLLSGDEAVPAGRVNRERAMVFADRAAARAGPP